MKSYDIVIVGVGGQGILLTSKILGALALEKGYDIKMSEVHGMSQRGGSVITHVRLGTEICAPLVSMGQADFVLAFEHLEALRAQDFLKEEGVLIQNTQQIDPMPVIMGVKKYPTDKPNKKSVLAFDALQKARESGNQKAVNIVMLGALSKYMDFSKEDFVNAIQACVPAKFLATNIKAFELGQNV